jgi:hypothetical protein
MGRATLLNGFVATAAGVVSNQLVATTASFASPFVASAVFLMFGYVVIRGTWIENYGGGGGGISIDADPLQLKRLGQAWRIVRDGAGHLLGSCGPQLIAIQTPFSLYWA